jgi:hypothetical protein
MKRLLLVVVWVPRGMLPYFGNSSYLSFTKSKTKIAHTPTVTGNCAASPSRKNEPLGSANVSKNIATAVSIPRTNLLFQFIFLLPRFQLPMLSVRTDTGGQC